MREKGRTFPIETARALKAGELNWDDYEGEFLGLIHESLTIGPGRHRAVVALEVWGLDVESDSPEVGEFCSELTAYWYERWKSRRIFVPWDGSAVLPEALMRWTFFERKARDFVRRCQALGSRQVTGVLSLDETIPSVEDASREEKKYDLPAREESRLTGSVLNNIRFSGTFLGQKVTAPFLLAGIQLFPRVDWEFAGHQSLKAALVEELKDVNDWPSCVELLKLEHRQAETRHMALIAERALKGDHGAETLSEKTKMRVLAQMQANRDLRPIAADRLIELTGRSRANIDQMQSRYRVQLSEFLYDHLDSLGRDDLTGLGNILETIHEHE